MNKHITSLTELPPEIKQCFSEELLSTPIPKLRDDCETIWTAYEKIITRLKKKAKHSAQRQRRFSELVEEFLAIYGWTAIKEKEQEGKRGYVAEGPFYYITVTDKRCNSIFTRLKYRKKTNFS